MIEKSDDFNGWGANMEDFPGTMNEQGEWFHPYKREIPETF